MHRLKQPVAILVLVTLLLSWGALTALIQGAEVEQVGEKVTAIGSNCYQYLAARKTKPVVEVGVGPMVPPDAVISKGDITDQPVVAESGQYCPLNDMGAHVDQYLAWTGEHYAKLVAWGRALTTGCWPPGMLYPTDPALIEACYIAYDGARWECFLELYNRTASPYYGRGVECVKYLRSRGRDWFSAITIMELESTCGMAGGSNDMGILDGRFQPGDLTDWCDYLDHWQVATFGYTSNELPKIAQVYNDHDTWRANFYQLAGDLSRWFP